MLEPVAGRARPEEVAKIGEAWTQGVPLREIGVFFGVNPDDRSALKRIQNIAYRGKFQRPEGFVARIRFGRAGSEKIQNAAVPAALAPSVGIGATPSAAPREQPAAPPPAPAVAAPSSEPHMVTHDQARHWGSTHGIITPRLDLDLINAKRVRLGMPVFGIVQSARLAR